MDIYKRSLFCFYNFIVHRIACQIKKNFTNVRHIFIPLSQNLVYNEIKSQSDFMLRKRSECGVRGSRHGGDFTLRKRSEAEFAVPVTEAILRYAKKEIDII